jgi:crossover junction endodeoxyribonuclease RuvC
LICFGIDPGIGAMGYGVVRDVGTVMTILDYGAIFTKSGLPMPVRLRDLYNELTWKMEAHSPDVVAVERLYFGRNSTTAEMVFQARGVILLAVANIGIIPYEPKPSEVKMAVCGSGAAEKSQVQGMVRRLLNMDKPPRPDDAADALAVAITGLALARFDNHKNNGSL